MVVGGALAGVGDGEAGEQHHDLGGDRDAGAGRSPSAAKIAGSPASRTKCEVSLTSVSEIEARTSNGRPTIPAAMPRARWRPRIVSVPPAHARLDRPDEQPARAGHAPGDRAPARGRPRRARDRARLRADARAVRAPRASRTPRSAAIAASGSARRRSGWCRARRRSCAGRAPSSVAAADPALRHRARPRLQRRDGRRRAAAHPELDDVRLRVGDRPAQRQLPAWRARWSCPTRSRPSAWTATARKGKVRAYEGLKEEYYLADFEPDAAVLGGARARPRSRPIVGRAHAAGGVALPPLRERPVRARARASAPPRRAEDGAAGGGAPARGRPARGARARARASSCPSTRSTRSR